MANDVENCEKLTEGDLTSVSGGQSSDGKGICLYSNNGDPGVVNPKFAESNGLYCTTASCDGCHCYGTMKCKDRWHAKLTDGRLSHWRGGTLAP